MRLSCERSSNIQKENIFSQHMMKQPSQALKHLRRLFGVLLEAYKFTPGIYILQIAKVTRR